MVTSQSASMLVSKQLTGSRPTPVTTNRNNLNRPRIFSFRAKLQTPQSVSMPWCATMKPNRGCFREGNPKPLILSGFQASEPAVPLQQGCNRMGDDEVMLAGPPAD